MYRVLHVIETIAPHEGGPPRVVAGLAVAQRALGLDAHILSGDAHPERGLLKYWQEHAAGFPAAELHASGGGSLAARRAPLRSWLNRELRGFDLVHIHQLWRLVPTLTARACRRAGVPDPIAPHTSLSPWALRQKRTKKTVARWLMWNGIFAGASGFHALNELEAIDIRRAVGSSGRVYVVPNGVSLQEFTEPAASVPSVAARFSGPDGDRPFILFLARLHTMKGPDLLLEAFAQLAAAHPRLQLVYAGPDFGMLTSLRRRASHLRISDRTHFMGLVSGPDRLWLLRNAVCLAQPSRDEGFSLSILEGLACGRPVVISDRCKFPEVARNQTGLVVQLSVSELAAALDLYSSDARRSAADGRLGRALIECCYTWDRVAQRTAQMYADVTAASRPPVHCDLS